MFLVIPVENKPSWKSPPWATILLIVLNVVIYFGWQVPEEHAASEAAAHYAQTNLPKLELPYFVSHLEQKAARQKNQQSTHQAEMAAAMLKHEAYAPLYEFMLQESHFRSRLLAEQVITPASEHYALWRNARNAFASYEPPEEPFTLRWAQNYGESGIADVFARPATLLTCTFLHGSIDHLLGNMLFLCLFGFALEMALGAPLYLLCYVFSGIGASLIAGLAYAGNGNYGLGASGAIAGLMGMYAVLYRLRRIKFFYIILFYFNYARLPALLMLPVWMGHELLQHWLAEGNVAYMAHFGGLVCGAFILWLLMAIRPATAPVSEQAQKQAPANPDEAQLAAHISQARSHANALQFEAACKAWRSAAKLRPADSQILQSWFEIARHWPASDDFHTAARMIFQLRAKDDATRLLQQRTYQIYLAQAQPSIRLRPAHMAQIAHSMIQLQALDEAERLCRILEKTAPTHPTLPTLLSQLVNAWIKNGQPTKALAWQIQLSQLAPKDPVTLWLANMPTRK